MIYYEFNIENDYVRFYIVFWQKLQNYCQEKREKLKKKNHKIIKSNLFSFYSENII